MQIIDSSEAKISLSKLIEPVLNGQEVVIGIAGKSIAKLVPYTAGATPRTLGLVNGKAKFG